MKMWKRMHGTNVRVGWMADCMNCANSFWIWFFPYRSRLHCRCLPNWDFISMWMSEACVNLLPLDAIVVKWRGWIMFRKNEHRIKEIDINKRRVDCWIMYREKERQWMSSKMKREKLKKNEIEKTWAVSFFPCDGVDWLLFYVNKKTNDSYVFLIDLTRR